MRRRARILFTTLGVAGVIMVVISTTHAQPGPGERKDEKKDFGPKGKGPPPKFELGRVLPPFLREELNLTEEQSRQIQDLEQSVKQKLESILTREQLQRVSEFRPKGPKGPKGPPEGGEGAPPAKDKKGPLALERAAVKGGIQWFATWESGLREARRSGRPILLVSAAPHCAGVSGVW